MMNSNAYIKKHNDTCICDVELKVDQQCGHESYVCSITKRFVVNKLNGSYAEPGKILISKCKQTHKTRKE